MKLYDKIITVIVTVWLIATGAAVAVGASSLAFEKTIIIDEGEAYYNVVYEKFQATSYTDGGTAGNQQISYVKADADTIVNVVAWSKVDKNGIAGANLLNLAADFEKANPGWTVLAGINGDYYDPQTFTPVNALVQHGNVIKSSNHQKYFAVGIDADKDYVVLRNTRTESKYSLAIYNPTGEYVVQEVTLDNQNL